MMNEETEQFEQRLRRQPMKQIPGGWRVEILAAAAVEANREPHRAQESSLAAMVRRRLRELFWPHPAAWAGLAAAWLLVLGLNFSMREQSPELALKPLAPSQQDIAELRQQHRLYAELVGITDTTAREAVPPRDPLSKPRSERVEMFAA